jgi:hypothetical protein
MRNMEKTFSMICVGMFVAAAFCGCISEAKNDTGTETKSNSELSSNSGSNNSSAVQNMETQIIEMSKALCVGSPIGPFKFLIFDGKIETKSDCKYIFVNVDGNQQPATLSFELTIRATDMNEDGTVKEWKTVGPLPLELKISEKELVDYTGSQGFEIMVNAENGVEVMGEYTATVNLYYGAPPA